MRIDIPNQSVVLTCHTMLTNYSMVLRSCHTMPISLILVYFLTFNSLSSAEDMAKFVDNYPEYRKMHGNVSKHVTLVTEMSKIVEERKLMVVSQTEQDLACNGGQGAAFEVCFLNEISDMFAFLNIYVTDDDFHL